MEAELAYSRCLPEVRKLLGLQTGLMISRVGSKRCAAQRVWGLVRVRGCGRMRTSAGQRRNQSQMRIDRLLPRKERSRPPSLIGRRSGSVRSGLTAVNGQVAAGTRTLCLAGDKTEIVQTSVWIWACTASSWVLPA